MPWLTADIPPLLAVSNFEAIGMLIVGLLSAGGVVLEHLQGGSRGFSLIQLGNRKSRLDQMQQALEAIHEADPNFDLNNFCAAATRAFLKLEKAIDDGDLSDVRAFVSDGIYQRIVFRLDEEKVLGRSRRTLKLEIDDVAPAEVSSSKNNHNAFEVISLRFSGTATREYRRKAGTGEAAVEEEEPISEVWTFLRRRGAKTTSNDFGSIEGNCPNCGADVSVNQWETCQACGSTVRSGEHDWVLSEITDQSSWKVTKPFKMSSATRYWIKQDQGFSSHYLEDRASVIFFRKFLADRLGKIDPLGKVATDRFCNAYEQRLSANADGSRIVYLEPRILAADVSGVIAEEPLDKALMHIRWSARRGKMRKGKISLDKEPVQTSTMMVLVRKNGTRTRIERTITSSHCPNCGAPESNTASHSCEFCQAVLNDGSLEWTMADMLPFTSTEALALRKKAYEGIEPKFATLPTIDIEDASVKQIVSVEQNMPEFTKSELEGVQIDGHAPDVDVREDDITLCRLLIDIGRQIQVPKAKTQGFIREVARQLKISDAALVKAARDPKPMNRLALRSVNSQVLRFWLRAMINAALVDAQIESWEKVIIAAASQALGLSRYDAEAEIRARMLELEEVADGVRGVDLFSWVVITAAADGRFDPEEVEQLKELADQYGISRAQLKDMCQAALNNELSVSVPSDPNVGQVWLIKMIDMAFADGNLCKNEQKVLAKVAGQIGLTPYDLKQLIRRRRAVLYKKARETLKGQPVEDDDTLHLKADWND